MGGLEPSTSVLSTHRGALSSLIRLRQLIWLRRGMTTSLTTDAVAAPRCHSLPRGAATWRSLAEPNARRVTEMMQYTAGVCTECEAFEAAIRWDGVAR